MLSNGTLLTSANTGLEWRVERLLGSGGQGEVYLVKHDTEQRALKWYFPHFATPTQRNNLSHLINRGAPSDRFIWPLDLVTAPDGSTFGYLMPLLEPRFKSPIELMKGAINPSFRAICTACLELAHHYRQLHSQGWAYHDISLSNFLFDPNTGEIRIVDNDNVCTNGSSAPVMGTPYFMAPEIVRGEATPSAETDLYSLAVLLFHLLFVSHPLNGEQEYNIHCFDLPAMQKLYGTNPVFIFDPNNSSNRPVPGWHDNAIIYWRIYPQFIRDLFTRAFTEGLKPEGRVRESEWQRAMARLRDSIIFSADGSENFYDPELLQQGKPHICWHSRQPIPLPPRLKIEDRIIMLTHVTTLSEYHFTGILSFDRVLARVVKHPTERNIWGLRNESGQAWHFTDSNGMPQEVPHGKSVTLRNGLTINFGGVMGEIRN
ncbi:MAG: serine/threonine protein kinase [Candidatus Thermofonsia Clade 1 bacterium]|uniref:Serine/threonine protein kinase n=1 Tax=Candidatus Thermofonsia Clade 1 bacterium TaxID=2364210 RepID=A0A2M8P3G5_9CHLR|nr:MAG: serine/threonine protein kinase [Candidatus Thermofonsia Clade 1 bacterium]